MDDATRLARLLYSISHDLQEPVRKIDAFTRLLMQELDAPTPKMTKYAGYVTDGAARLRKMIDVLLFLSRMGGQELRGQALDPSAVDSAWHDARPPDDARLDVGALAPAEGDVVMWQRIWHEVIDNAIRFRDAERPLQVIVRGVPDEPHGYEVIDNGIGIPSPPESAFELFKSLHGRGEYGGIGAGLAVAAAIVEFHGGIITIAPRDDGENGTRVFFTWPPLKSS